MGTCGIAAGAREVMAALLGEIERQGVTDVLVTTSGCAGLCSREPMATVEVLGQAPVKYANLTPEGIAGGVPAARPRRRRGDGIRAGGRVRDHRLRPQGGDGHGVSLTCAGMRRDGMRLVRIVRTRRGDRSRDRQARPGGRGPGGPHRLPGVLRGGAGAHRAARRGVLLRAEEIGRADARRGAPAEGAAGHEADVHAAGGPGAGADAQPDPVLRQAEAGRPAQPRADRPGADRGLHRAGRLRGAGQGARRDDAGADHPGDQALRPARARRRRLPRRRQVGDVPPGGHPPRRRADRRLQRRRGRPRRVHGSEHHRERPALGHRGHGHRRAGHRRDSRASSTSATSTRSPGSGSPRRSTRRASTACSAAASSARSSTSTSRSCRAPARSCAASRRR